MSQGHAKSAELLSDYSYFYSCMSTAPSIMLQKFGRNVQV